MCYSFRMGFEWTDSSARHGVSRADALHAMANAEASAQVAGMPGEVTMVYIGRPHPQSLDYLEVIAAHREPRTVVVFHVMHLTDQFRYLLHEGEAR